MGVIKLNQNHYKEIYELCINDPVINCYVLSDIKAFGLDEKHIKIYGEYKNHNLISILMFYSRYATYFTIGDEYNKEFNDILDEIKPYSISGGKKSIDLLNTNYSNLKTNEYNIAILKKSMIFNKKSDYEVKKMNNDYELTKLYKLLKEINEFNVSSLSLSEFIKERQEMNLSGSIYGLYIDKELVSTASAMAETVLYAVINAVATKQEYRGLGYASTLIDYIISEYISVKKKGLILYYNNPTAAKIYKKRGFIDYDIWVSINPIY